jgi:hypothetical protein
MNCTGALSVKLCVCVCVCVCMCVVKMRPSVLDLFTYVFDVCIYVFYVFISFFLSLLIYLCSALSVKMRQSVLWPMLFSVLVR